MGVCESVWYVRSACGSVFGRVMKGVMSVGGCCPGGRVSPLKVGQKDLPAKRFSVQKSHDLAGLTWSGRAPEERWARIETDGLGCVQLGLR